MSDLKELKKSVVAQEHARSALLDVINRFEEDERNRITDAVTLWVHDNANADSVLTKDFWQTLSDFERISTHRISGMAYASNYPAKAKVFEAELAAAQKVNPKAYVLEGRSNRSHFSGSPRFGTIIVPFINRPEMKQYVLQVLESKIAGTVYFDASLALFACRTRTAVNEESYGLKSPHFKPRWEEGQFNTYDTSQINDLWEDLIAGATFISRRPA